MVDYILNLNTHEASSLIEVLEEDIKLNNIFLLRHNIFL